MAKVAVVLTSYNRPKRVVRAIESVLSQTFQDFHLYVMDNNSKPELKETLQKRYGDNPKITLYFTDTKDEDRLLKWWYAYLQNLALSWGNEPILSHMSDDEYYMPKKLEYMVKFLDKHPKVAICYCTRQSKTGAIEKAVRPIKGGAGRLDSNQVMFRRSLWRKVGGWKTKMTGWSPAEVPDADFFNKVKKHGYIVYPIDFKGILVKEESPINRAFCKLMRSQTGRKFLQSGEEME